MNVRVCCDAEEETGGHQIVDFLAADERGADAAIIFDSGMTTRGVPEFNVATRGLVYFHLVLRTGARDLHSGVYGGAALNAMHALSTTPRRCSRGTACCRSRCARGSRLRPSRSVAAWAELVPGTQLLDEAGVRGAYPRPPTSSTCERPPSPRST